MPFDEARSLTAYWDEVPPAHESLAMMLAALTTWEPAKRAAASGPFKESTTADLLNFAAMFGVPIASRKES